MLERIGITALGLFVGFLLGLGLFSAKPTLKAALTVLGAALGGAPVAFLAHTELRWIYPVGLLIGFVCARVVQRRIRDEIHRESGSFPVQSGQEEYTINYRLPYENPPHLDIKTDLYCSWQITKESPTGFTIYFPSRTVGAKVLWTASGKLKQEH